MTSPLSSITGDFVKTCTIQACTKTQNTLGEEVEVWTDIPGHIDINCIVSRGDGSIKGETHKNNMVITFNPLKITLLDAYPAITTENRVVWSGVSYNILDIWTDQLGYHTVLQVVSVC